MSENTNNEQNQKATANAEAEMEQRVADEQCDAEQTDESTGSEFFQRLKQKAQEKASNFVLGSVLWAAIAQHKANEVKDAVVMKAQQKVLVMGAKSTKKFITTTIDESSYETATIQDLLDTCDALVEHLEPSKDTDDTETK